MYGRLYDLYRPYNERLYDLLGREEWSGVWDDSSRKIGNGTSVDDGDVER
jgi:hypothetical protein